MMNNTAFDIAWDILKAGFVDYSQGFSGFTPQTAAALNNPSRNIGIGDLGVQPRPNPLHGFGGAPPQYSDSAASLLGQGYVSNPQNLEQSLTQAQQNAYAQGNAPSQQYGLTETLNPFNKDPNVQEHRNLNRIQHAKNMYRKVNPSYQQTASGLDNAGGVPLQEYHTRRAANEFARVNQ
tara:strand:+ start:412 stop:948 length:537 start_codon:yes stop_codon:yes gene_type:complete